MNLGRQNKITMHGLKINGNLRSDKQKTVLKKTNLVGIV